MPKTPLIFSIEEKSNIMAYVMTNRLPSNLNAREKQNIKRKSRNFVVVGGELYYMYRGVQCDYVCDYEEEKIVSICTKSHIPGHSGM